MTGPSYDQVMQALQAADAAGNVEDAHQLAQMAATMMQSKQPQTVQEKPSSSALGGFGRRVASLADTTIGGIIPSVVGMAAYPIARLGQTPEEAKTTSERIVSGLDKPFGKAVSVFTGTDITNTPEYQTEQSRKIVDFIGANFQKGAKWISEKTGIPQADVESYMGSLSIAASPVLKTVAKAAGPALQEAASNIEAGVKAPFEAQIKTRNKRLSSEDYARGPQIDAAKEAKRLGVALNPADVQPTFGKKLSATIAGPEGQEAIQKANIQNVRKVALNEMGMSPDTPLDKAQSFSDARSKLAEPYNKIGKLPTMVGDADIIQSLDDLRPDSALIGKENYATATNKIIDQAIEKVSNGLDGSQLLKNVQTLRKDARRTYNNKNADVAALDKADTQLALANVLETMAEKNVSDPKLLQQFRDSRQKMARIYAYEAATDKNKGIIDVSRLAKITAKDNAMSGDIASLGKIAGNYPDAFSTNVSKGMSKAEHIGRAGFAGSLGGLAGYALGGDYASAALGSLIGAGAGELGTSSMARRIASPEYQKGLSIRDARIPLGQAASTLASPIPQSQAIVPYQAPVEVLNKGEGPYQPNFTMQPNQYGPRVSVVPPETSRALPAPSAESTMNALRAEDVRRAGVSRALGQQAEASQAAAEAASRKSARGEVMLELDPITGRLKEVSQGLKGATPETFTNFGKALETASEKVSSGTTFKMTAAEKVAWDKTRVNIDKVLPGYKALSDKTIAEKMLDRQWVAETASKAREKAVMFEQAALRAKTLREFEVAKANREKMMDIAAQMEESMINARPNMSRKIQGPKTRAAKKQEGLFKIDLRGMAE